MFVEKIKLINFRNISSLETSFSEKYNIFYGKNAQGKTNLLESISLLLNGVSHRETKNSNFIKNREDFARLEAFVKDASGFESNVSCVITTGRKYQIDGENIGLRSKLLREYNLVSFTPEDVQMIKGSPDKRRRFLDESIGSIYPAYHNAVIRYKKALAQRNALLKDYSKRSMLDEILEAYDKTLHKLGSDIMKARINVLRKMEKITDSLNSEVAQDEKISFYYSSNILAKNSNIDNLEETYETALKDSLKDDIYRGYTTMGVHHDDLNIFINDLDSKKFASQGQQRSIALCMKLSLIELLHEKYNDYPVVLLDDVMSDLDAGRQKQIITLLNNTQSFITCVDKSFIDENTKHNIYEIQNGQLIKEVSSGK